MFWILPTILCVIVLLFALKSCLSAREYVDYSEFYKIVHGEYQGAEILSDGGKFTVANLDKESKIRKDLEARKITQGQISDVYIDSYVISFEINDIAYETNFSRASVSVLVLETRLNEKNVDFNWSNPNAGSIWSSLMPLIGCVAIAAIFLIIMMQTGGGTKGAMNFAKTNAKNSSFYPKKFSSYDETLKLIVGQIYADIDVKRNITKDKIT